MSYSRPQRSHPRYKNASIARAGRSFKQSRTTPTDARSTNGAQKDWWARYSEKYCCALPASCAGPYANILFAKPAPETSSKNLPRLSGAFRFSGGFVAALIGRKRGGGRGNRDKGPPL